MMTVLRRSIIAALLGLLASGAVAQSTTPAGGSPGDGSAAPASGAGTPAPASTGTPGTPGTTPAAGQGQSQNPVQDGAQASAQDGAPQAARKLSPEEAARAAAEAALEEARGLLNQRFEVLQDLVVALEDDHAALTSGPGAATRKHALVVAMTDALPAAASQLDAATAQGRRPSRQGRAQIIAQTLAEPVGAASPVDSRLSLWLVDRVAEGLAARGSLEGVDERDLLGLLDQQFEAGESWYAFWNRVFHQDHPAAAAYAKASEEYEQAGLALDRLRFPERYGPRGERAPAGMVVVPGGVYELGPNAGYKRPARKLNLKPLAMDRREVTNREYATFVNAATPSQRRSLLPRGWVLDAAGRANPPHDRANHPVLRVSWDQAAAYATWAGKRLPTEGEWEAAAAGFEGRAYPWGDAYQLGRSNGAGVSTDTLPVESFPASRSPAGCFDMAGNVWEWTATLDDGSDIEVLPDGPVNVIIRGGSFEDDREKLTTRYRWIAPGHATYAHPGYDRPIGFRCVSDL